MHNLVSLDGRYREVMVTTEGYRKIKNRIGAHCFKVVGPFVIIKEHTCEKPDYTYKKRKENYTINEIAGIIVSKDFELSDVLSQDYFIEYCDNYSDWNR